jgi:hypothetical protein
LVNDSLYTGTRPYCLQTDTSGYLKRDQVPTDFGDS